MIAKITNQFGDTIEVTDTVMAVIKWDDYKAGFNMYKWFNSVRWAKHWINVYRNQKCKWQES